MNKIDLDRILPLVQKPSRYIDGEWNSIKPKPDAEVNVCLCFPDLYEIGASNLGLQILYHIVNNREDASCQRCYCPDTDLEKLLKERNIPLFSLESSVALKDFDIVGFTMQYELCATNIVNMLSLSKIPLLSQDRDENFPLIIAGGPVTANPEPYAEFIDLFVLGDGEEAISEIIEKLKITKGKFQNRKDLLFEMAQIPGVYVPLFYNVEYNGDGTIKQVKPNRDGVPGEIKKRTVDIENSYFPTGQLVPYTETVHNRLNIEIARGCFQGCRFCQASKYYSPHRARSVEKVLCLVEEGLRSTGYEEVALSSLSCTDYKGIEKLLEEINKKYSKDKISISLPSMRCDQFSLKIAGDLGQNKRSSLTFAPEAGSERMRRVIGKNLTGQTIKGTLALAWKMGWKLIKLYFMIGLQTESEDDISGINDLVRTVKAGARNLNLNVSVSPFVPKPQTAFQWVPMEKEEVLKDRLKRLLKTLPASVKHGAIENSVLEGAFARGDRKLSRVILRAWQEGSRFDQWREKMRYDLWQRAFSDEGIDMLFYNQRARQKDEVFPWDHLVFAEKSVLRNEFEKAMDLAKVKPEMDEPLAFGLSQEQPVAPAKTSDARGFSDSKPPIEKLRLKFARTGDMRFVSHLEQIEVFRRSLRRSGLPLAYTTGFHPQPRMSFGPAVSVGHESGCEFVEAEFLSRVRLEEASKAIGGSLPPGYSLVSAKQVPVFFPSIDSLCNVAEYETELNVTEEQIREFLGRKEILVEKIKKGQTNIIDVKPLILKLEINGGKVVLRLRFGPKKTVKPEMVLQKLCGFSDTEAKLLKISRTNLFMEKKDGTLSLL